MPTTPFHLGPGVLIKSVLQQRFSLTMFAFSQGLIDIQPVLVILLGKGHLHGFTHTYLGAIILALIATVIGKPICEWLLRSWNKTPEISKDSTFMVSTKITWKTALLSSIIGTYSHIILDSFMHSDIQPFYPFSIENSLVSQIPLTSLHLFCIISGSTGLIIICIIAAINKYKKGAGVLDD